MNYEKGIKEKSSNKLIHEDEDDDGLELTTISPIKNRCYYHIKNKLDSLSFCGKIVFSVCAECDKKFALSAASTTNFEPDLAVKH